MVTIGRKIIQKTQKMDRKERRRFAEILEGELEQAVIRSDRRFQQEAKGDRGREK